VALTQADVLDRSNNQDADAQPKPSFATRLRGIVAVLFVCLGLLATVAWIAFLGWLLYRAVLVLGIV
jgi:hypothetical protein